MQILSVNTDSIYNFLIPLLYFSVVRNLWRFSACEYLDKCFPSLNIFQTFGYEIRILNHLQCVVRRHCGMNCMPINLYLIALLLRFVPVSFNFSSALFQVTVGCRTGKPLYEAMLTLFTMHTCLINVKHWAQCFNKTPLPDCHTIELLPQWKWMNPNEYG